MILSGRAARTGPLDAAPRRVGQIYRGNASQSRVQRPIRRIALRIRSICLTNSEQQGHLRRCSRTRTSSITFRSRSIDSAMTRCACLQVRRRNDAVISGFSLLAEPVEFEAVPEPHTRPVEHHKGIRRRDGEFLTYLLGLVLQPLA